MRLLKHNRAYISNYWQWHCAG